MEISEDQLNAWVDADPYLSQQKDFRAVGGLVPLSEINRHREQWESSVKTVARSAVCLQIVRVVLDRVLALCLCLSVFEQYFEQCSLTDGRRCDQVLESTHSAAEERGGCVFSSSISCEGL